MAAKKVTIEFEARIGKLEKELETIQQKLGGVTKKQKQAESSVKKSNDFMTNSFKKLGAAIAATFAAEKIISFTKQAINAASDLNETISKTEQIFEDSAGMILQWSQTSATALGISRTEALDAAATFATFGKSAGLAGSDLANFSTDLAELSSDFASFFNTSPEDAIVAIGAALRGESEPIRRYGVLLNDATLKQRALQMGIISTTSEALTPQVKVLAAQAEIFAQAGDAQGDFARTSEGMANQSRIATAQFKDLTAELGENLLPIATETLGFINKALTGMNVLLAGTDATRLNAALKSQQEGIDRVVEAYAEQGDAILRLSQREVETQRKRLETGIANIDQIELEKMVYGEARSEAIKLSAAQRVEALKRMNLAQAEIEAIEAYIKKQEGYNAVIGQGDENTIAGLKEKIKLLTEEASKVDYTTSEYQALITEIDRLKKKLEEALSVQPRVPETALTELETIVEKQKQEADAAADYFEAFFTDLANMAPPPMDDMLIPDSMLGPTPEQVAQARQMYLDLGMTEEEYAQHRFDLIQRQAQALLEAGALEEQQYAKIMEMQRQLLESGTTTALSNAQALADGMGAISGALIDLLMQNAKQGGQAAEFAKQLALFQLAIDTGVAISGIIKAASQNPANVLGGVPAIIAQIAAGTAIVLTNIARARAILTQDVPQFEQGGMVGGQLHSSGGTMIEAERGEYVINRKMTAKYKDAVEAINRGNFDQYILSNYITPLQRNIEIQNQSFAENIASALGERMDDQTAYLRKLVKRNGTNINNLSDLARIMQQPNINRLKA